MLTSPFHQVYWVVISVSYAIIVIPGATSGDLTPVDEKTLNFDQILPVLLLAIPLIPIPLALNYAGKYILRGRAGVY